MRNAHFRPTVWLEGMSTFGSNHLAIGRLFQQDAYENGRGNASLPKGSPSIAPVDPSRFATVALHNDSFWSKLESLQIVRTLFRLVGDVTTAAPMFGVPVFGLCRKLGRQRSGSAWPDSFLLVTSGRPLRCCLIGLVAGCVTCHPVPLTGTPEQGSLGSGGYFFCRSRRRRGIEPPVFWWGKFASWGIRGKP